MYSEKLENLITLALADGVLTDKKRQVLLKNAESEGIDLDEFEMVLEARLYEIKKNGSTGICVERRVVCAVRHNILVENAHHPHLIRAGGTKYQYRCITFRPEWDGGVWRVVSGFYQYIVPNGTHNTSFHTNTSRALKIRYYDT